MKKILMLACAALLCTQCNFRKMGRDTGAGFNDNMDSIGRNLVAGVNRGLADEAVQRNLRNLIDSLVGTAGNGVGKTVQNLMDTLLSDKWIHFTERLVEEATGRKLRDNVAALSGQVALLRNDMLGPQTRQQVQLLMATALDGLNGRLALMREELTGPALRNNVAALRDSLLNDRTNAAIKAIIDTAMMTIAYRMKHDVKDAVGDNASFIQKYAGRLLVLLGIIALVIIIVVWRLKEKYAKMTSVLATQIHTIPDKKAYDELTLRIKQQASAAGVEPSLRKVLQHNGLMAEGRKSWMEKKEALLEKTN